MWSSSRVVAARWRLGLFGFYTECPGFPDSGLAISLRGLLVWLFGLGAAAYVGAAGGLAWWFHQQPHNEVGFADVLSWPIRRQHIAHLRGRAWLAQGRDALQARRWADAVFLLRHGLDRCPEDFEARFALARFYMQAGDRSQGLALLADGPSHGLPSRSWRESALETMTAGEDWTTALKFCTGCLSQMRAPEQSAERQQMLAQQCVALTKLDRAAEALTLAEAEGEAAGMPVKVARGQALLALGRPAEAASLALRWRDAAPNEAGIAIRKLLAVAWREAGRPDEMERTLADLLERAPTTSAVLVFAVEQRVRAGQGRAALDDYLFHCSPDPAALQRVAVALGDIPDAILVRRVLMAAAERGYDQSPLRVTLAMALLKQGDLDAFAREVVSLAPALPHGNVGVAQWLAWAQNLSGALASPARVAQDPLVGFMRKQPLGLPAHERTVAALHRAGRDETALEVLVVSRRIFAESPSLQAQQAVVERTLAARPASPPPQHPVARAKAPPLAASWDEFIAPVDDALARTRWAEAAQQLSRARTTYPAPEWMATHDGDLQRRELHVAHGAGDAPQLRMLARLYVNTDPLRIDETLDLARAWHAAQANDDAVLLVQTVLEKSPGHALATQLLAEWRPPTPPSQRRERATAPNLGRE